MAQTYKCRPSEILHIKEEYAQFCFDEACAYIINRVQKGETPMFRKHFTSIKDALSKYSTK